MAPRGLRNNNPLNIRKGNDWKGERHPQCDPAFEEFVTLADGVRAAFILAVNFISGEAPSCKGVPCRTVLSFIEHWAPACENDVTSYVYSVCQRSNLTPSTLLWPLKRNVLCRLLWAMAWHECGQEVSFHYFENACRRYFPAVK